MNLSTLILAALGAGIIFGSVLHDFSPAHIAPVNAYVLAPIGEAFLRLIQFVVVPIVFAAMILGLTRIQNAAQVGRYAVKLIASYVITSAIAVCLGMSLAMVLQPGAGISGFTTTTTANSAESQSLIAWLVSLIPVNPLTALSSSNLLQTIVTAALIGVGIQLVGAKAASFVAFTESVYAIFEKILALILYTAPIGVFALISSVIATEGLAILVRLLVYVLGLLIGSLLMIGLYAVVLYILKAKPLLFFQSLFPALSLAFGTASSNAALPIALQTIQEGYGLRSDIASFAVPLGTALKRDGSAILQGFNALFIAQVYHVPITPPLVLAIALSSLLVSFSTPGVPGSGIITMTTVLGAAGLPLEGVAIVAGVDRLVDGVKTVLNVVGNTTNAIILACWEPIDRSQPVVPPATASES